MDPTSGKTSCCWMLASVLTWLIEAGIAEEVGSDAFGSIATRPERTAVRAAAEDSGSVEELGAGGARIAEREEKALRAMKAFILIQSLSMRRKKKLRSAQAKDGRRRKG